MAQGLHRRWRAFRNRFLASGCGSRFMLLLRLENMALLSRRLGAADLSQLLGLLAARIGTQDAPIRMVAPGLFAIPLPGLSVPAAMRLALDLQASGQQQVTLPELSLTPVLTGILIHDPGDIPATHEDQIGAARHRLLSLQAGGIGHIHLADYQHDAPAPALKGRIIAHFQPQLCCHTGKVTGFEALARLDHPTRGLLRPADFMAGLSEGDHDALSREMLRQALMALKLWDEAGHDVPTVSLNISDRQLSDPGFANSLLWELDRQDVQPSRLVLELLENVGPVSQSATARRNLTRLTAAGCLLDLDDFGIGNASMDAIRHFGISRLKIDRSFVTGCDHDPGQQRMILAMLALAERLEIETLAEGVETREEHGFLAQMGCGQVQGHAIGLPMSVSDSMIFLQQHAAQSRFPMPLWSSRA